MPIYEYACSSCGHEDDLIQKASERPKRKCPECGRMTFKRKISTPSFHLKGTGWYETDFKNKNAANNGSDAKPDDGAKTSKSDDGKSTDKPKTKSGETKSPAAKSESKSAA